MKYIELESVGSLVTNEGLVFPMDISEAPETASEAEEMLGVHIMDVDDEWWPNLSVQEMVKLFQFLAETKLYEIKDYFKWAMKKGDYVVAANGYNSVTDACMTEGWEI